VISDLFGVRGMENTLEYLTSNDWALIATKAERVAFTLGHEIIMYPK